MDSKIEILIGGDFCPINRIENFVLEKQYDRIYNDLIPILQSNDLSIINLECPLIKGGYMPIKKTGPNIKGLPEAIEAIKYAKINVLSLANNHILDFGEEGIESTINLCRQNSISIVGAGSNLKDAKKPLFVEVKNRTIGIINIAENEFASAGKKTYGANPLDVVENYKDVIDAKKACDFLILIIHGGNEYYHLPNPEIRKTYRFFASAGADLIVSHHTHCLSGYEYYANVPIFYGLGNFIFDWNGKKPNSWHKGILLKCIISNNDKMNFELIPFEQSTKNNAGTFLLKSENKIEVLKQVDNLSGIIKDDELIEEEWLKFCMSKEVSYYSSLFDLGFFRRQLLKRGLFKNRLIKRDTIHKKLNLFRCESHRKAVMSILEHELR